MVASVFFRDVPRLSGRWWRLVLFFFLATASHGLLDALTDGGLGVAFFSPFDTRRYFLPWRPVEVSPIGLGFFGPQGLRVIRSEMVWIWLPSLVLVVGAWALRRAFGLRRAAAVSLFDSALSCARRTHRRGQRTQRGRSSTLSLNVGERSTPA